MKRAALPSILWLSAILGIGGCQYARTGSSSFEFVDGPQMPTAKLRDASKLRIAKSMSVFMDAEPILPLAKPVYPKSALAAGLGDVSLAVKFSVNTHGRVESIGPSFARVTFPTRFKDDFDGAIEAALAQWRFKPAYLARLDPQVNDAPVVVGMEETETSFDVVFKFSTTAKGGTETQFGANDRPPTP